MAKWKHRPQTAIPREQLQATPQGASTNRRLLWGLLAGGVIIVTLIGTYIGLYIPRHRILLLAERLATLEKRVNSSSAWGRKVSQWVEKQKTPVKHDHSVFAPMWYSIRTDSIFINDDLLP